ncbi:MAG: hypothetical protein QOK08_646 [Actinomycetota bacterium]|jgi:UPF0755 protein|nr:hypothetical protein [Actinomycetota bacterium]MDQ1543008.1 hypothetical protein [Actinomycetota bacterium]
MTMAEPSWEDLFGQPEQSEVPSAPRVAGQPTIPTLDRPASRRALREREGRKRKTPPTRGDNGDLGGNDPRRPKRRHRFVWLWVVLAFILVVAGIGTYGYETYGAQIRSVLGIHGPIDYTGTGDGKPASVTILSGQIGGDIAKSLVKAGVTKTTAAFYDLLVKETKQPDFQPGTYKMQKQMSAKSALAALLDPKNRVESNVVIPEGYTLSQVFAVLSKATGVPLADFQAAAKDYTALGVPKQAPSLEGFLFPATYQFDPGLSAKAILQEMVNRMNQSLASHGVSAANELKVLTLASIIQKEGGSTKDFYKVSRVFTNRLAQGMDLQSDATVSYGAGSKTIDTTNAQRADASNPYNTYVHAGLPIGPIAAPGDAAIDAALHPVAGNWLYFVLVNGYTGETVFSATLAEHNVAVLQWQAWARAHPTFGK